MKIKSTFVTNSSSASFTILKHHLNELQIQFIYDHIEIGCLVLQNGIYHDKQVHYINDPTIPSRIRYDEWNIQEDHDTIRGFTTMDNFDMYWFLTQVLKIKKEHVDYDHSNNY